MLRLSITNDFWTPFCAIRFSVEFSYKVKNKLSASLKENSFNERNQFIVQSHSQRHVKAELPEPGSNASLRYLGNTGLNSTPQILSYRIS